MINKKPALTLLLPQAGFARNVLTLMTGTAIAQAIPVAISPILTRLYTPGDFGIFALFMAICGITGTIVTGRYEMAITLPKEDENAINVAAISVAVAAAMSAALLLIIIAFNDWISGILGPGKIGAWLYFVPLSMLLTGIYQSLNFWANRKRHYRWMASSRVMQSVGTAGTQLGTSVAASGSIGLIMGYMAGQLFATVQLARAVFKEDRAILKFLSRTRCKEMALRYLDHPKLLVVSHGISSVYAQIPIFFVSKFYSLIDTGHVSLAYAMVAMPTALVANAIGDVFRQRATDDFHKYGRFDGVFRKTLIATSLLGLPFFLILFFLQKIFSRWCLAKIGVLPES